MNIRLLFLVASLFLISSCQNELENERFNESAVIELPNGELQIPLNIVLPHRSEIAARSVANDKESAINNIWAVVFQTNSSDTIQNEAIITQIKSLRVKESGKYYIVLEKESNPCQVQLLINVSGGAEKKLNELKTNIDKLPSPNYSDYMLCTYSLQELYKDTSGIGKTEHIADYLPMASPLLFMPNGITLESTKGLQAAFYFNYSRIDIKIDNQITNFELLGATLVNGANHTTLSQSKHLPVAPHHETTMYQESIATEQGVWPIYLFPNSGALMNELQGTNKTFLIVRGIYTDTNNNKAEGFYKLAIRYEKNGKKEYIYDIVQNTLLSLTIHSIKNAGYPTFEGALAASETNISYDIVIDDEISNDIVMDNGEYYMGVSNSEAWLYVFPNDIVVASPYNTMAPIEVVISSVTLGVAHGMQLPDADNRSIVSNNSEIEIINQDEFKNAAPQQTVDIKAKIMRSNLTGDVSIRCGNLIKNIIIKSFDNISFKKDFQINVPEVAYAKIVKNYDDYLRLNTSETYPSSPTPFIETPMGNLFVCGLRSKVEEERLAEIIVLRNSNLGSVKMVVTQQKWQPRNVTYYYDLENEDISKRANSYMLPLIDEKTIFRISVKRVNDYWNGDWTKAFANGSGFIFNGNNESNTLGKNINWKPTVIWADFDFKNKLELVRYKDDGINIILNADFTTKEINSGYGGNIVIGVENDKNEILWSWHLWITNVVMFDDSDHVLLTPNCTFNIAKGEEVITMLDRCLGVKIDQPDETKISSLLGLYYQWGRKDPFAQPNTYTHEEPIIYTPNKSSNDVIVKIIKTESSMPKAVNNPLTFYFHGSSIGNYDWIGSASAANYEKMNRWNYIKSDSTGTNQEIYNTKGIKTIFDPCPYGWRVPWGQNWFDQSVISSNSSMTLKLYIPKSGYRSYNTGNLSFINEEGRFWSGSCPNLSNANYLSTQKGNENTGRSYGYSVFPIVDR